MYKRIVGNRNNTKRIISLVCGLIITTLSSFSQDISALHQPYFLQNKGQYSPEVLYVAFASSSDIWITKSSIIQDFHSNVNHSVEMVVSDACNLTVEPIDKLSGQFHYYQGKPQSINVERFSSIILPNVATNIDMRWYFDNGYPRYDFIVRPGGNPNDAFITFKNIKNIAINSEGELCFEDDNNLIQRHQGLLAYQVSNEGILKIPCEFLLTKNQNSSDSKVNFNLGVYDRSLPLVIDPVIMGAYFGSVGNDKINDIKIDELGNIYVAGTTNTPNDFPSITARYRYNTTQGNLDGFVAKFTPDGKNLVYYCIIGGTQNDEIVSMVLDKSGSVIVGGYTNSPLSRGFPITPNAPDTILNANDYDGFVAQFTNEGSRLEFCTYVGDESQDSIRKIVYDDTIGALYVVGVTRDDNRLPLRINSSKGGGDVFYQAINIPGKKVLYSGYFGGTDYDAATSIALYKDKVIIGGYTNSNDIKNSNNGWRGGTDGFITRINKTTGQFISSHYYGGSDNDRIIGLTVDTVGFVSVCGTTNSTDLPTAGNSFSSYQIGEDDGFIAQFNEQDTLKYGTYIGGAFSEELFDIKEDSYGQIYVFGNTKGEITTPPVPKDADFNRPFGGGSDCFWVMINPRDTTISYVTYIGGANSDFARALAINQNHIYCGGFTSSSDFQPIRNGFSPNLKGGLFDGYFCIQDLPERDPIISPTIIDFGKVSINSVGKKDSIIITNRTSRPIYFVLPKALSVPFSIANQSTAFTLNPTQKAKIYIDFLPTQNGSFNSTLKINYGSGNTSDVLLKGEGVSPSISIIPSSINFGEVLKDSSLIKKLLISNIGTAPGYIHFLPFTTKSVFNYLDSIIPKDTLLNIGENVEVSLVFTPKSEGVFTDELVIETDSLFIKGLLQGEGIDSHVSWNVKSIDFGQVRVGKSITKPAVISNSGKAKVKLNQIKLSDDNDLSLMQLSVPVDSFLRFGDSIKYNITFTPSKREYLSDSIKACTNSNDCFLLLEGKGINSDLRQISPTDIKYGSVSLGMSSLDTIQFINFGDDIDTLYSAELVDKNGEDNFEILTPKIGTILSPDIVFEIIVAFHPQTNGNKTNLATIKFGNKVLSTNLSGVGVIPQFELPTIMRFGKTSVGSSDSLTAYIKNIGTDTGWVGVMKIISDQGQNFSIEPSTKQNFYLPPNDSSPITIKFSPRNFGVISGSFLEITDSGKVLSMELRGEAYSSQFISNKKYIDFIPIEIGKSTDSFFVISNLGNSPDTPIISNIQNNNEGNFQLLTPASSINANDSIKIYYRFTPKSEGQKTAFLQVSGGALTIPYFIQFYGLGYSTASTAELQLPKDTISAKIGDKLLIPIILDRIDGKKIDSVRSFNCKVRYNSSILGIDNQYIDSLKPTGNSSLLSLHGNSTSLKEGDTLFVLKFTVGLGNSTTSDVIIEQFEWKNNIDSQLAISTVLPQTQVKVTDVIEINGKLRLYEKGQRVSMNLQANTVIKTPLIIRIEGSTFAKSLIIYDESGRAVADITRLLKENSSEIIYDSSWLAKGMYYCVLTTSNSSITKEFVIQ
ncbi:MAG: choice-of-anchor D domain-containing protein [Bacteroidetes bacterium]|nr:choice-of-anchor D domain-containing protein [Bacteroidota bacterium]